MGARTARVRVSSLLTLGLLLLPAGVDAASVQQVLPEQTSVQPVQPKQQSIAVLAAEGDLEGFDLQDVTVVTGEAADGADELVSAKYLGAGTRNEIRYRTFSSQRAAEAFTSSMDPDTCSPDGLVECVTRVANVVVSGLSASTCPHPTHDTVVRAETLMRFGASKISR